MSVTVSVEEAQEKLKELILRLAPGDELIITDDEKPIASLVSKAMESKKRRLPGLGKGMITIISDDDEHLADFADYMP